MLLDPTVRPEIAQRYWERAVVEELALRYRENGFRVARNSKLQGVRVDLRAEKAGRIEIVEVKAGYLAPEERQELKQVRTIVANLEGASFKLVYATPPSRVDIMVERLDEILGSAWAEHIDQSDLADIASIVLFEAVSDVSISRLHVRSSQVDIAGEGVVEIEAVYGSGKDESRSPDSYPFAFHLLLNEDMTLDEVIELRADTSSFYE